MSSSDRLPRFLKSESDARPVGVNDLGEAIEVNLPEVASGLISLQDEVRADFGWAVERDISSIHSLLESVNEGWPVQERNQTLLDVKHVLTSAPQVAILGAAVEPADILGLPNEVILVSADGSCGVIDELSADVREMIWSRLVLVVSDGDGGKHLAQAAARGIPFALHAHGDNVEQWGKLLEVLGEFKTPLFVTHQCPDRITGAHNVGGFTDGDRAACILSWFGIHASNRLLLGFRSDKIGRWTGVTSRQRKLRKLKWMDDVLAQLQSAEEL